MNFKRKLAVIALTAAVVLGCASCASKNTDNNQVAEQLTEYQAQGSVIFEKDGVKVTTAGLDTDPSSADNEPIIWIDIENNGENDAYLGVTNGVVNGFTKDVLLIEYYYEDGECYGGSYDTQVTVPAGESGKYALGFYGSDIPGVSFDAISELELCFTTAKDEYSWHDYTSDPVIIKTGVTVDPVDLDALGTVVVDNDTLKLVIGDQDYDDFFGPYVYTYVENKTDHYIGVSIDTAVADGAECDYNYYYASVAPGKYSADTMMFDSPIKDLKGFEELTLGLKLSEAKNFDDLMTQEGKLFDTVTVKFPPQVWGEYENGGLYLEIKPKYNSFVTVETPENDADGILFAVSETASLEAVSYEGAGWLFSIGKVDEDRLHEMLCGDMFGAYVFAKDDDGNYYICYTPTDVRYERATAEEMDRDIGQWAMLCDWAEDAAYEMCDKNAQLENFYRGNTELDIYVARAAYEEGTNYTVSTTEFGPVSAENFDAAPYAEAILGAGFYETERDEAPDGEYVVLNFPDEDVRLDFFFAEGNLVRKVSGDYETFYETWLCYDDDVDYVDIMQGWYYALAESTGVKEPDTLLGAFEGDWAEKMAGRGMITISKSLAPGKVNVVASWPNSASEMNTWEMTAILNEEGGLSYENGHYMLIEFDEDGEDWITDERWEESGEFYLNGEGNLCWRDDSEDDDEDSEFIFVG